MYLEYNYLAKFNRYQQHYEWLQLLLLSVLFEVVYLWIFLSERSQCQMKDCGLSSNCFCCINCILFH